MSLLEIIVLALALSADAFSVGAAVGLRHHTPRQLFRLSFHFGLFQALMPLLGALAGTLLIRWIADYDHWVVFGLLAFIGGKMIREALTPDDEERAEVDLTRGLQLIGLSLAVSIDALAAGVTLVAARAPIALSVTIIGVVCAASTVVAMLVARRIARRAGRYCELGAGVVLILIGLKVLADHLGWLAG